MNLVRSQIFGRLLVITLLLLFGIGFCIYWYLSTGGHAEGVNVGSYKLSFASRTVKGLRDDSEVRIAGVTVGRVTQIEAQGGPDGAARVDMLLNEENVPVHQGGTVRVGLKDVIGSDYVDLVDGKGAPLPSGTMLPDSAVLPTVGLDDVVKSLRPETRAALSSTVRSLDAGTKGQSGNLRDLVSGVGNLGRDGYTSLDALAAQTEDLTVLSRQAGQLIDALDTGRGEISSVVQSAQKVTAATAGQQENLKDTLHQLPGVLGTAQDATKSLTELSGPLGDVAHDLKVAAPDLNDALLQLPDTVKDVRGLLPTLDTTLGKAPATLVRVPPVASDVRRLIPQLRPALQDANPLLQYASPFGRDIGAMLASFGRSMMFVDANGTHPIRLAAVFNTDSFRNVPVQTTGASPLSHKNPFPAPGSSATPATTNYSGTYTRVYREPAPFGPPGPWSHP